ncbi:D-2-hydroxyacid dehydrogenase [Planctomicrobium sp. SH664]|uniref:D-2-hydroxyacid dehydrogenase n=1 Tax=Planctomicrobium sp. SH664 TaxID=3448125 RepID=UPI003F5AF3E6
MAVNLLVDMPVNPQKLAELQTIPGLQIDCLENPSEEFREIDPQRLRGVHALFCTRPPTNFSEFDNLQWIQLSSTGYTQIFGLDLVSRGIRVTNARGCFDVPIAEWNIAMMVNLSRNLRQMLHNQEQGRWDRSAAFQSELRGSVVGLWGYGGIGRETARLAKLMGLKVHVLTRHGTGSRGLMYAVPGTGDPAGTLPDRVFTAEETAEFLQGLDFLIIALPLTSATEGMIGERELKLLPKSAFVLNPSRGPIIQRAALLKSLQQNWIAGAALDTHYQYPTPPEDEFWRQPNVIFTPHIAGSSLNPNFLDRIWDIQVQNTRRFIDQAPLLNELTVAQLQGK